MSVGIQSAARRLCAKSKWSITNLKLQKLLYVSHMRHLGVTGNRLINAEFEAWDFGPVEPNLYQIAKIFGNKPIQDIFFRAADIQDSRTEARYLDSTFEALKDFTPGELVAYTHWNDGAWARNYKPGLMGIVIPDTDVVDEYRARISKASSTSSSSK